MYFVHADIVYQNVQVFSLHISVFPLHFTIFMTVYYILDFVFNSFEVMTCQLLFIFMLLRREGSGNNASSCILDRMECHRGIS